MSNIYKPIWGFMKGKIVQEIAMFNKEQHAAMLNKDQHAALDTIMQKTHLQMIERQRSSKYTRLFLQRIYICSAKAVQEHQIPVKWAYSARRRKNSMKAP